MDDIKRMVAQAVQHHALPKETAPPLPAKPPGVLEVEATRVSDLVTQVRVKTFGHGVRYFTIKVSENI